MTAPANTQAPQSDQMQPEQTAAAHKRTGNPHMWLGVATLAMPVLFVVALLVPSTILRIVFLALSIAALIFMWVGKAFGKSARTTVSLIYAALMVVIAVALFVSLSSPESNAVSGANLDPEVLFGGNSALDSVVGTVPTTDEPTQVVETPEPVAPTSAAELQLNAFMSYWAENQLDSMVSLCLPSWSNNLENPKTELFVLLANRTPLSYTIESVSGSDVDTSRTITLTVLIDKKSTAEPAYYQMQVLMLRINENWYVDPNSLGSTKLSSTPMPGETSAAAIPFVPTEPPAATDAPEIPSVLYYNADGGSYYHADPDCYTVGAEYKPLTPFNYTDLNSTKFKNLLPCNKCHSPTRPLITGD